MNMDARPHETQAAGHPPACDETLSVTVNSLLHGEFERRAREDPESVALVVGEERVSYRELDARANRLARHLRGLGIGVGDRVALCAARDANLYVSLLGILKSGASYVPVAPELPHKRRSFVIGDSQCRATILSGVDGDGIPGERVDLLASAEAIASLPATAPDPRADPDSTAYVIYTSGTTGRPKGVPIRHRQVADRIATMRELYAVEPEDRVLQFASLAFDASVEQVFTALSAGATLVARTDAWSLDSVLAILAEEQVTVAEFTPTVWADLTRHLSNTNSAPPAALTRVVLGGERVDPAAVALWFGLSDIPLYNTYGPTETTITATAHRIDSAEEPVVIGAPIPGVRAYVMNSSGSPVADGEVGELWIGGSGTAEGYLGRPDLTTEHFVTTPDGERTYRTGDLVRWTDDGTLEYHGRTDDQVKIGGVRIEPGEVVATLTEHPEVAQAHVEVRRLQQQDTLIAHVVPADHRQIPSARRLRAFLSDRLPAALIPGRFSILERMPLLPSGKLDRDALAEIAVAPQRFDGDYVEPKPGAETRLAAYWAEELGLELVGAEDDLLSLGTHSLRTMRIAARIARTEHVDLSVGELLAASTVRAQAELVGRRRGEARRFPPIPPSGSDRVPMSDQQKQIWFLGNLDHTDTSYRFQATVRISGPLDLDVVDRVITELHRRHAILRTTYSEDLDGFWQHVHAPRPVSARRVDLRELPEAERRAAADARVQEAISVPLDLTRLPLQRWTVIRIDDEHFELVLLESHMVHDGWSFAVLMREFTTLYNAYHSGEPSPLPEPALSYGDYAAWQQRQLGPDGALRAQLTTWREYLDDLPAPAAIHPDYARTARMRHEGDVVRLELPGTLPDRIRAFCREHRVTLFEMLFSAFCVHLYRHTGQSDLCVGSAFANRRLPETQDIVGMFVNTVLLRASIDSDATFEDVLAEVHRSMRRADNAQEVPFPEIVRALNPERSAAANPFTQVMFSAHDSAFPELDFGEAAGTISYPSNRSAKFDLNVIVLPAQESTSGSRDLTDKRITMEWEYNSAVFARATIERMAGRYVELLERLLNEFDSPVRHTPILGDGERSELATLGRGDSLPSGSGDADSPPPARVVDYIRAWANRSPDTVAVRDDAGLLTYGELDDITDAVARDLLSRGLEPEAVVGVFVDRSRDLPIAAVAAHKARVAYAPIDPAVPRERLAAVLDGVDVVFCSNSTVDRVPHGTAEPLVVEEAHRRGRDSSIPIPDDGEPGDLAYVIFTSGSTGTPKGVLVEQDNLSGLIAWSDAELPLPHGALVPLMASQSFDASVWEMWRVFAAGASCLMPPEPVRKDPDELVRWLNEHHVTHCFLPTPLAIHVVHHHRDDLPGLQWLGAGGDRLELPLGARLPFALSNLYGPAETTVIAAALTIPAGTVIGEHLTNPSIGRPIAGAEALVVDESGRQVPIGVPGELMIGGRGVGRGYLRSEHTDERFTVRAGLDGQRTRYYRSGDLVRWNIHGELECLGRLDRQIKIRGFRIEPGEIEAALRAKTAVSDCAVVAWHGEPREDPRSGEGQLVAFIVQPAGRSLEAGTLRAALKDRLPEYMIPSAFVAVDEIPLTVNGKIDPAALPDEIGERLAHSAETVPPRDEFERIIADMWTDALGIETVGVHDNFFDLGGHSLMATQLINRLEHRTGIRLSLREVYESPTIATMRSALLERVGAGE